MAAPAANASAAKSETILGIPSFMIVCLAAGSSAIKGPPPVPLACPAPAARRPCYSSARFSLEEVPMISLRPGAVAVSLALLGLAPLAQAADAPNYRIVDRIKVPDGGFDYATFDAAT